MVGFNADVMFSIYDQPSTDGFRPFSKALQNLMSTTKALEALRAQIVLNDEAYMSYLFLLGANIEFSLKNDIPQNKQTQDLLVELQGLISTGETNDISEEILALSRQLLFKSAADFLLISNSTEINLVPILSSLSYQSVDCYTFDDPDIAAWSTWMALDSLTLLLSTYQYMDFNAWRDPEIGDQIVMELIPNEGRIRRLHAETFQLAKDNTESLMPNISEDLPDLMAERLLSKLEDEKILKLCVMAIRRSCHQGYEFDIFRFFKHFVRGLKLSPGVDGFTSADALSFSSTDFAVFLQWMSQWSEFSQPNVLLLEKLHFLPEQISHWKSVALFVKSPQNAELEDKLRISTVIRTVRGHKSSRNILFLFKIFAFMKDRSFPEEWTSAYANNIYKNMVSYVENPKDHLFHLRHEEITVDEEDRIYQEVSRYIGKQLAAKGEYKQAISIMEYFENPTEKLLREIYDVTKMWLLQSSGEEKLRLQEKRILLKKLYIAKYGKPVSRCMTPAESISAESISKVEVEDSTPLRPPVIPKIKSTVTSPSDEIFYSPASVITKECGTCTDESFVSAPQTPRAESKTPISAANLNISSDSTPPQEPIVRSTVDETYQPPQQSFFIDELSAEEEERYLLQIAEQKLTVTQQMFNNIQKGWQNKDLFDHTAGFKERYHKALEDLEKLKLELENEKRKNRQMFFNSTTGLLKDGNRSHPTDNGILSNDQATGNILHRRAEYSTDD